MYLRKILFAALTVAFATACAPDMAGNDAARPGRQATAGTFELKGDAARGEAPYVRNCASCHGNDGRGDGPAGRALNPSPTDLTTASLTAERAYKVVNEGGMAAGLAPTMPPFRGAMDEQTIHDVVAYVLSLEN